YIQFSGRSAMHVFQRQRKLRLGFRPAGSPSGPWARSGASHSGHTAKQRFEEIAEGAAAALRAASSEEVFQINVSLKASSAHSAPIRRRREIRAVFPIRPELVVFLALFGIAQNLVGFLYFFEFFFGLLVVRVEVRMIFAGEFAVRLFDFVVFRGS